VIRANNVSIPWFSTRPNKKANFHSKGLYDSHTQTRPPHPSTVNSFFGPRPTTRPSFHSPAHWNPIKQYRQICHKPGHTADTCSHRYDSPNNHSFTANVSQYYFSANDDSTPSILGVPSIIEDPL